jgi:hypothetical protein
MSMDRSNADDCRGKVAYPTKADAQRAAKRSQKRKGGPDMAHFFCPHCQGFHIGRQLPRFREAAARRRGFRMGGAHGAGVSL